MKCAFWRAPNSPRNVENHFNGGRWREYHYKEDMGETLRREESNEVFQTKSLSEIVSSPYGKEICGKARN